MSETTEAQNTNIFSGKAIFWILLVSLVSFSALVMLNTFGEDLQGESYGRPNAISKSAVGYEGMVRLLKANDVPVITSRAVPTGYGAEDGVIVVTPNEWSSGDSLDDFRTWRTTLIVLPKWSTVPSSETRGWVEENGRLPSDTLERIIEPLTGDVTFGWDPKKQSHQLVKNDDYAGWYSLLREGLETGDIRRLQVMRSDDLEVVLEADAGPVLLKLPEEPVFILTDPDILNTQGINDINNARAGYELITQLAGDSGAGVTWDLTLHGFNRSRSLMRILFTPPFLSATLCLLMAALLIGWQALTRFGAPQREEREFALGKGALAENSAGLVFMARREPAMSPGYVDLTRRRAAEMIGSPKNLSEEDLTALLDRLGEKEGTHQKFSDLAQQARSVGDAHGLVEMARKLYRWRQEINRADK